MSDVIFNPSLLNWSSLILTVAQMMQKSANSLGTKITDRLMYFQKYLGESMLFFQAIYIPFPKSKGFFGGAKKPEARRDFNGKNGTIYHGIIKKNRFAGLLPLKALSNKSMEGNFPTS